MKKLVTPMVIAGMLITASPAFADYTVQSGDSLSQIAVKENITLTDLIRLNPQIPNPNLIFPNDVIKTTEATTPAPQATYSTSGLDVLSRIVEAEAGGEPFAGKVAVAEVIMNRVASSGFPNTIQAVVYEPGQFEPVMNGTINNPASADSISAAKQVLTSYRPDPNGILFFYAPSKTSNSWIRTRQVVEVIGHQVFSK